MRFVFLMVILSLFLPSDFYGTAKEACGIKVSTERTLNSNVNSLAGTWNIPKDKDEKVVNEISIDVTTVYAIAMNGLNVRSTPSTDGKIVNVLDYGTPIRVDAVVSDYKGNESFLKVAGNTHLYISSKLVVDHEPVNVQLAVKNILQNPQLPDGCEITSLTMVMNYIGEDVDKCYMSDNFLPKSKTLDADPNEFYLREPRVNGFYCFAGPLVKTVNAYNEATGKDLGVIDLTGCEVNKLYEYIEMGQPVVVWGTLYWNPVWRYESGLYSNLHCMVLSGFSEKTVTINDPLYGITYVDREQFERVWIQMERRAMTVYKK